MRALLMVLAAVWGMQALAGEPVAICDQTRLELLPRAALLEDPTAMLMADQVAELPQADFIGIDAGHPPYIYSASAFWLRVQVVNDEPWSCQRWLTVGYPHLGDIQVHMKLGDNWQMMRAGNVYPHGLWPARSHQSIFPLELQPYEKATLLIRVFSQSLRVIEPTLWSELELLGERHISAMIDGFILGLVLLLVPFSLMVAWILRSRLLVISTFTVLSYFLLVCVINGYLVYWSAVLPFSREAINGLLLLFSTLFLTYIRVLLHVRRLPAIWGQTFTAFLICLTISHLWFWFYDYAQGRLVHDYLSRLGYGLILATFLVGLRRRLPYGWVAWVVIAALMLQGLIRLLQPYGLAWQVPSESLTLPSTLPGLVLLTCTLVMEVSRSRERETQALQDLDRQQQAEHERLENTVSLRTAQLRESLQARSSLMARISHDLRSPLVGIIEYARMSRSDPQADYSHRIERSARQQLELITELLEFSRGELQQLELTLAPGYLYGFLREVEEEGHFLATRQGNRFECQLAADLPALVQADFRRLRQVLLNLLGNAAKFTRHGRITLQVSSVPGASAGHVQLYFRVSDTGIGFAPSERSNLLQPFRRGNNVGLVQGSGLGLSIVVQLLGYMGSELEIDSMEQGGSQVGFRLQLTAASEDELDMGFDDSYVEAPPLESRCVLLVDDVALNREWLYDLLSGYGVDVLLAENGQQALELLEQQPVDLVLTDQVMPVMDGWALLQHLRREWPGLPVLLYSATPARRPEHVPADLAFDGEMLKPADATQFLAWIADVLPSARAVSRGDDTAAPPVLPG